MESRGEIYLRDNANAELRAGERWGPKAHRRESEAQAGFELYSLEE